MQMPGGGPFNIGPGQITDDSELAMCLMQGIVNSNKDLKEKEERLLSMKQIAK